MSSSPEPSGGPPSPGPVAPDDRASNFGCGIALVIAGGILLAQQLGYVKGVDWLFPAILLGWGASYLYAALRRS